jgi:hypothetical protein
VHVLSVCTCNGLSSNCTCPAHNHMYMCECQRVPVCVLCKIVVHLTESDDMGRAAPRKRLRWLSGLSSNMPEHNQLHVLFPDPKPARQMQQDVSDILLAVYLPERSPSRPVQKQKRLRGSDKKAALARPYDVGQDEASDASNAKYRSIDKEEEEAEKKKRDAAENRLKRKASEREKVDASKKNKPAD